MKENALLARLRAGEVVFGLGLMYPAPGMIEGMASGWDWIWIDGQHGQFSYDTILHAVQVSDAVGLPSVVRVPGHEHGFLGPYADTCPAGIMVPMVNSADEAEFVVEGLRFPPLGKRSYGGRRVIDLGGRNYFREQELAVCTQVETLEAVENAAEIIAVEGVDGLFFGPDDMKTRMNIPINTPITESEELRQAMARTAKAARDAGKVAGCVAVNAAAVQMAADLGYQLIVGGGDVSFLRTTAAAKIAELRGALAGRKPGQSAKAPGIYGG